MNSGSSLLKELNNDRDTNKDAEKPCAVYALCVIFRYEL